MRTLLLAPVICQLRTLLLARYKMQADEMQARSEGCASEQEASGLKAECEGSQAKGEKSKQVLWKKRAKLSVERVCKQETSGLEARDEGNDNIVCG